MRGKDWDTGVPGFQMQCLKFGSNQMPYLNGIYTAVPILQNNGANALDNNARAFRGFYNPLPP